MMKIAFLLPLVMHLLLQTVSSEDAAHVVAVTYVKANLVGRYVIVKTMEGKQKTFYFSSQAPVSGIASEAISQKLSGGVGYQFLIKYVIRHGDILATGFDYIGREAWKTAEGKIVRVDASGKQLFLQTPEGATESFAMGAFCVRSNATKCTDYQPDNAQMKIRYTEPDGKKTAHLLEDTASR